VLLAGQVGSPRRVSVRAVVQRSRGLVIGGVLQQVRVGGRPAELDRRVEVNAASIAAVDVLPLAVHLGQLEHADTVGMLRDTHVVQASGWSAKNVAVSAVLVVENHNTPL